MNALVSGRSGRALILDGESVQSFDLDDPDNIVPRHPSELAYLFGEAKDVRVLEDTTVESVAQELERECQFTWALDLTLISLDAELADDIRNEALEALEELFADGAVIERVENVLYAAPLPEDADLAKAKELCEAKANTVREFFERLETYQPGISIAAEAWEIIPVKKFPTFENKQQFRNVAVREGLYRALATFDNPSSVSTFLLKSNLNGSVQQLPSYRQILQEWTKPFRQSPETRAIGPEDDEEAISDERFGIDRKAVLLEAVNALLEHPVFTPKLQRICRTVSSNWADADDLFSDVCLKLPLVIHQFDPSRGSFESWLRRVTQNLFIERLRRRSLALDDTPSDERYDLRDPGADPEKQLWQSELTKNLNKFIAQLGDDRQRLILTYYFQDLSFREIEETLKTKHGIRTTHVTARSVVHKLLKKFFQSRVSMPDVDRKRKSG